MMPAGPASVSMVRPPQQTVAVPLSVADMMIAWRSESIGVIRAML